MENKIQFQHTDTSGRTGHLFKVGKYLKCTVKHPQEKQYLVYTEQDVYAYSNYVYQFIRHRYPIVTFLGKDYLLEEVESESFKEYYWSEETQKKLISSLEQEIREEIACWNNDNQTEFENFDEFLENWGNCFFEDIQILKTLL